MAAKAMAPYLQRITAAWAAGAYTNTEFFGALLRYTTSENVADIIDSLPSSALPLLFELIAKAPMSDADWEQLIITESDCSTGTVTAAQRERWLACERSLYRIGVEAVRTQLKLAGGPQWQK